MFHKLTPFISKATLSTLLIAWLIVGVFPFLWMTIISFRLPVDAFSSSPTLFTSYNLENFYRVWIEDQFYWKFLNTIIVTVGVTCISLTLGCLGGYALSRYAGRLGFWILLIALIFRALPYTSLLPAYKLVFHELGIINRYETIIIVLVVLNQPFTLWMLRSFFVGIPKDLDEAALVDGCGRISAFFRVIMPVMWPGVITTGLFSLLLAYNDFVVSSQLLVGDKQTVVSALSIYMNADDDQYLLMQGIAGAVSVMIPLVILVIFFQRHIVAGLVQGAVKG